MSLFLLPNDGTNDNFLYGARAAARSSTDLKGKSAPLIFTAKSQGPIRINSSKTSSSALTIPQEPQDATNERFAGKTLFKI